MQRHCHVGPECFQNVCASTFHSLQASRGAELYRQCTNWARGVPGACISPQRAPFWGPVSHATLAPRGLASIALSAQPHYLCSQYVSYKMCCLFLCGLPLPRERDLVSSNFFGRLVDDRGFRKHPASWILIKASSIVSVVW